MTINYPSLVLVQPRKTRPCLTERLLMGRKESNQTNKKINMTILSCWYKYNLLTLAVVVILLFVVAPSWCGSFALGPCFLCVSLCPF